MAKVSIIIPVYNTEKYLRKCLDSVINQTLSDIEIICINDSSPDNSLEILNEYASKDNRIKIINFEENKGVSVARNTGIDAAQGEYIGFVDSDDFVDSDFYEKLYNKAIETNADVVKGNIFYYEQNTGSISLNAFYDQNILIRENKTNFLYGFTSGIYKTNLIKKYNICFPKGITHFEDPYFSICVTLNLDKIKTADEAKYYYRKHDASACNNSKTPEKTKDFIKCTELILDKINSSNLNNEDYSIYFDFLFKQIFPWCSDKSLDNESKQIAKRGLSNLLRRKMNKGRI